MRAIRFALAALAISLIGFSSANAQTNAPPRKVQDDLNWFSKSARDQANEDIALIKRNFRKDLAIETVKAPERPRDLNPKDAKAVSHFFDEWAIARFKNERVDGVMILLVDEPKIVRILVGPETAKHLFPAKNREAVREKVVEFLKQGKRDAALTAATFYVAATMGEHHRSAAAPGNGQVPADDEPRQTNWMNYVWIGLGVLLVFWLVRSVIRAVSGGGQGNAGASPGYAPGYGGGSGGGFFSNFVGGLFGAAAGMWMYNNFFGGHHASSGGWGSGAAAGGASPSDPSDLGAGDPSVSGGDYGADPSAPPAGGGDWNDAGDMGGGGGDWGGGGGDFGGGGDWGGGGGDF